MLSIGDVHTNLIGTGIYYIHNRVFIHIGFA